jgi:DNA-binding NarL/FixJ family response regulator
LIRVAVFEDNSHLRDALQILIDSSSDYTCAGVYSSCKNMIPLLEANPCDIILMDIEMPGMNGIEATGLIKETFPAIQVLIQTVFFEDEYIFNAICAGAAGYILKSTTPEGYLRALDNVQAGGSPMTPGIARRVLELFKDNFQSKNPVSKTVDYKLSSQEKRVLELLVGGGSYKMIAAEMGLAHDTIKSHITKVYAKLQVHSGTEAVARAIRDRLV